MLWLLTDKFTIIGTTKNLEDCEHILGIRTKVHLMDWGPWENFGDIERRFRNGVEVYLVIKSFKKSQLPKDHYAIEEDPLSEYDEYLPGTIIGRKNSKIDMEMKGGDGKDICGWCGFDMKGVRDYDYCCPICQGS